MFICMYTIFKNCVGYIFFTTASIDEDLKNNNVPTYLQGHKDRSPIHIMLPITLPTI